MHHTTFNPFRIERETHINLPQALIERLHCGLFRAPLTHAAGLMPELAELFASAPVENPEEWELDLKVHMLIKGQYPCIPNWHCDNVLRVFGKINYNLVNTTAPRMLLWISDGPETEFLKNKTVLLGTPEGHGDLAKAIVGSKVATTFLPPQTWASMDQLTPHRGTQAAKDGWRIFIRLTHRSIAPDRPVLNHIRRHCQVYLDATQFEW
jgi:hypothetical protein